MIELKNIHKYYNPGSVNELCLFQKFSLEIPDGDFVAVVERYRLIPEIL